MKIKELIAALQAVVAADEYRADAEVTFGQDIQLVEGGSMVKNRFGLAVLNLAPIKLNEVGGF